MSFPVQDIIGTPVTALSLEAVTAQIVTWGKIHESRVVCVADANMLTVSHAKPGFNTVLKQADLVTPDGMPLVWMLKLLGVPAQERVAGMDIFLSLAAEASAQEMSLFFVGSDSKTLERMREKLRSDFPNLKIAGMAPLPFRPLTDQEDEALIAQINLSGAEIVLVALGCPKQEIWMNGHKDKIQAVMIGVGAVFPVYAGIFLRAPQWMRQASLEWAFRLLQEPRRLWDRYRRVIPLFMYLACKQLFMRWKQWLFTERHNQRLANKTVLAEEMRH